MKLPYGSADNTPMRRTLAGWAVLWLVVGLATPAHAQLNSSEATAALTAVLPESLTVSLLPNTASFTLTSGSASNAAALTIAATTTWTLAVTRTNLALFGYFSSSTA